VASYVEKYTNFKVDIIDASTERMGYPGLEKKIREKKPDIVGIYCCTAYLLDAFKTAELVKKMDKKIVVIAGGPHIFIYPKETILNPHIDFCVYGEGEIAFKELVECLSTGGNPEKISGIITKDNLSLEHIIQRIDDLDSLPFPHRKFLDYKKYNSFITHSNPITTLISSRGCVFNCYYCNNIERQEKVRMRSPENVVDEIEEVVRMGVKDILIFDENFTFNIKRVIDICDEIGKRKLKIRWHCRSRADMNLDESALKRMKEAGCRMIQFGIETGTQRLQKIINKNLNLENVRKMIKMAKGAGILTYGNFMVGLPTETQEEMMESISFAKKSGLDYAPFGIFMPLPESVFYKMALKDGIIKNDYWHEYVKNPQNPTNECCWPLHDKDILNKLNALAFKSFYLNPKFIFKALICRQSPRQKMWQLKSAVKLFLFR
jgi:radical SAM superfamily enzyme YgiQ (UPF0313 family)